ncbi:MAG: hypothetical protein EBW35_06975 [Rhodobacterales bacterium]|nr:hypothetical protein [Rhodobacterales bacterium]
MRRYLERKLHSFPELKNLTWASILKKSHSWEAWDLQPLGSRGYGQQYVYKFLNMFASPKWTLNRSKISEVFLVAGVGFAQKHTLRKTI